jgi:hypothetical protein
MKAVDNIKIPSWSPLPRACCDFVSKFYSESRLCYKICQIIYEEAFGIKNLFLRRTELTQQAFWRGIRVFNFLNVKGTSYFKNLWQSHRKYWLMLFFFKKYSFNSCCSYFEWRKTNVCTVHISDQNVKTQFHFRQLSCLLCK